MVRVGVTALILIAAVSAGCTPFALRRQTVGVAETVSEIYQQQVLDNLAMFVYDPSSLPHFAFASSGSANLTDTGSFMSSIGWKSTGFDMASTSIGGMRAAQDSWTLTPINDPRVLELMRCAYQRVLSRCVAGPVESDCCPQCEKRFRTYYTGSRHGQIPDPGSENDDGIVTSNCLGTAGCWLHIGCGRCVPKSSKCCRIGHYCGVYIWVNPGKGQEELTKLTLAVLDFAVNKPAPPSQEDTKEVTLYVTADGRLTTADKAERIIKATRPVSEDDTKLLVPYLPHLQHALDTLNEEMPTTPESQQSNAVRKHMRAINRAIQSAEAPKPLPHREPRQYPTFPWLEFRQQFRALAPSSP